MHDVNLLLVLVSAIIMMVVGAIWYSPGLFGQAWLKAMNKKKSDFKRSGKVLATGFITSFILAYLLSIVINMSGADTFMLGALAGFWVWLGFIFTTHLEVRMYEHRPWQIFTIYTGMQLVNLLLIGGLIAIWG
ncbi:hypothetical protein DRQ11_10725 [candidate division KSB1 bacterium]|nr:MAG: hypothetical protein DRQ11_10725 [candidate division KSB1 bacterium]